ncbi:MAG TPA: 2-oxo acid dehydrogenase subunit E2 [Anaerolineales bacterium]|jgi:pyruvate dehydrogenase E2 component (dihydrolipoamide acetyltransferase)|nr:2-oxo acid dehydrogenase subunit E2 [Anaerolineae bacterium]HRJ58658.1 2-oxo acid dehydrogenase subunit E2 [Anaerolineales bacterium]HRK89641.1 2-oxo acid dehydrogenase subunit E2 [Anaerolineales bacterium]
MPVPFIMPKFDMDQEKATIISWSKKEGDLVTFEESVLTVETEKVAIDVPSPASGILAGILFKDGEEVPVTKVIAYILKEGETLADLPKMDLPKPPSKPEAAPVSQPVAVPQAISVSATPIAIRMAKEEGVDLSKVQASGVRITREDVERFIADKKKVGRVTVAATPAARRVARENGVALEAVSGSGPRGRVQSTDVLAAAKPRVTPLSTAQVNGRESEIIPLTNIRRTIAERMQKSFNESPHIALTVEVDMTEAENARKRFNVQAEKLKQPRITVTALMIKVVAWALIRNPYINASFNGNSISLWKDVNIGVATAAPQGLVVPVLKGADHLGVNEINIRLVELAERARENRLKLEDVQGGTFTISNLGMFGIRQFRAVINPPESAILAVGSVVRTPIVVDEQDRVEVRPMMSLTISADHRVIDGIVAARFLSDLVIGLESPSMLLY